MEYLFRLNIWSSEELLHFHNILDHLLSPTLAVAFAVAVSVRPGPHLPETVYRRPSGNDRRGFKIYETFSCSTRVYEERATLGVLLGRREAFSGRRKVERFVHWLVDEIGRRAPSRDLGDGRQPTCAADDAVCGVDCIVRPRYDRCGS